MGAQRASLKVVIPGGSGQVGTVLARAFHDNGHDVVVLSRRVRAAPWRVVEWDGIHAGAWAQEFSGAAVVINLAGRSVNCRYTAAHRREIMDSRVLSTRAVGEAIAASDVPPRVWLQMSTATIYAHRFDAANDEANGRIGGEQPGADPRWRFSIEVARAWERAQTEARTPGTRKVTLRSAVVLSPDRGGIFSTLYTLVRLGLGGRAGDGRQFVSWIHERDFIRAVHWLIERAEIDGIVNVAAPHPLPNREFMRQLRRAAGVPFGLAATPSMLEIAAFVHRTETELLLKSRRVVPGRLLAAGFTFDFPEWDAAARDLCARRANAR